MEQITAPVIIINNLRTYIRYSSLWLHRINWIFTFRSWNFHQHLSTFTYFTPNSMRLRTFCNGNQPTIDYHHSIKVSSSPLIRLEYVFPDILLYFPVNFYIWRILYMNLCNSVQVLLKNFSSHISEYSAGNFWTSTPLSFQGPIFLFD